MARSRIVITGLGGLCGLGTSAPAICRHMPTLMTRPSQGAAAKLQLSQRGRVSSAIGRKAATAATIAVGYAALGHCANTLSVSA